MNGLQLNLLIESFLNNGGYDCRNHRIRKRLGWRRIIGKELAEYKRFAAVDKT